MQWTYDINGITPQYQPPKVASMLSMTSLGRPKALPQRPRMNYLRKNMKLTATAVSSPIKGLQLIEHVV